MGTPPRHPPFPLINFLRWFASRSEFTSAFGGIADVGALAAGLIRSLMTLAV
jgi:hypothetical protein